MRACVRACMLPLNIFTKKPRHLLRWQRGPNPLPTHLEVCAVLAYVEQDSHHEQVGVRVLLDVDHVDARRVLGASELFAAYTRASTARTTSSGFFPPRVWSHFVGCVTTTVVQRVALRTNRSDVERFLPEAAFGRGTSQL